MDNCKRAASTDAAFILGCYNPHSSILVYLIIHRNKPFNQGAWIACMTICKGEQKADTSDDHALHTRATNSVWTCLNENGVISSVFASPTGVTANPLLIHTASTTEVTRCKETGHCRMKNINSAKKIGALLEKNIVA